MERGVAQRTWRVLIVEDDPAVSYLHRKLIQRSGRFEVVEIVASGEAALMAVERAAPDLVLLDLSLQGADGVRLLRSLRARGSDVEAIAVTATSAAGVVRTVLQLGAVDYLVKPFTPERLHEALGRFLHRVGAPRDGQLDQPQVDAITRGGPSRRRLPKGLAEKPLEAVRGALETETAWRSAEQIAARVAMARVTTRRYLEYLVTMREADVELHSEGPGRPRKLYRTRALPHARARIDPAA